MQAKASRASGRRDLVRYFRIFESSTIPVQLLCQWTLRLFLPGDQRTLERNRGALAARNNAGRVMIGWSIGRHRRGINPRARRAVSLARNRHRHTEWLTAIRRVGIDFHLHISGLEIAEENLDFK